jgi:hypothetical protein
MHHNISKYTESFLTLGAADLFRDPHAAQVGALRAVGGGGDHHADVGRGRTAAHHKKIKRTK